MGDGQQAGAILDAKNSPLVSPVLLGLLHLSSIGGPENQASLEFIVGAR